MMPVLKLSRYQNKVRKHALALCTAKFKFYGTHGNIFIMILHTPPTLSHTHTHTSLYLGPEQAFNLPVTSVTAPTAAGTSPIAELTGWII